MKIAYLHGLESTIDQKDPKIIFLNKNFDSVYAPSINYQDDKTFNKLYKSIKSLNPDLIVGSSMGGYVSYLIGSKLSIPVLLFNPAMVGRTFDPVVDDSGLKKTKINIRFGKSDSVINGSAVRSFFKENGISFNHIVYNGGHRVPTDVFIDSIKGVLGVLDEMYNKIEKIQHSMKHIKLFEQFTSEAKKPGPDPYMRGLSDDEKEKKEDNMKKQADMKDDDPKAYKDLPGDKEAREKGEVKTSKHVKKYHELYGDEKNESLVLENDEGPIDDPKIETALKTKSEETGVPIGLIRVIMRRGLAAWKTGHRPGATSQQWGYARVNAFLTKGSGTWGDADKDIAKKVRDGGHDKGLKESVLNEEDTYNDYPSAAKANAQKAIDWKEKYGRDEVEAGTAVGWARAHQLAKGENLSADTVGRMSSFNRHRKNATISPDLKDTPWLDKGYVSWLIWGGDEGVDWAMATMDKLKKEESVMLPRYEEFVNEKKKSKPKSDKQKIKDLTKKQKGLSKKNKDFIEKINKMSKDDQKDPADKIESALLKSQMQQTSVDGMKIAVQKNQLALKSKLKTIKKRSKAGKK